MNTCERCRTENADEAQYCDECGVSLLAQRRADKSADRAATDQHAAVGAVLPEPGEASNGRTPRDSMAEASAAASLFSETSASGRISSSSRRKAVATGQPTPAAHARLTIHRGRAAGKEFPLSEDEAYIGRWDADGGIFPDVDLDADDPEAKVSRRHARITRRGEQYFIEDLGSTNGTFINRGRRLLPGDRQPLQDGDELIIGKTFLKFQVVK